MPSTRITAQEGLRDCFYDGEKREFLVFFRDGRLYRLPRNVIPEDDGSEIRAVLVERDGSAFVIQLGSGKRLEVPWDFVLYQLEPAYPYFKGHRVQENLEEDLAITIGRRVRELRLAKGLTTYELAQRSGIHRPNVSRIERGKHVPSMETIERLAQAMNTSIGELVARAPGSETHVRERAPRYRTRRKGRGR